MFAIAFLFLFLTFVRAVPQSPITATSSSSLAHPTHFPTSFRHSSSHNTLHLSHSGSQSHIIPSNTRPLSFPGHSGRPKPPPPTSTPLPPRPKHKPVLIAFEVIGGLALAGVLLSLIRCYYNYKRTPHRDRIADILQRHHLQRELEELERNPHLLRRPSLREPAPPYFPRPPSYDDLTSGGPLASRGGYSAVGTHSPPPSPPMSQIVLPVSTVAVRTPPNLIPPAPSG